MPKSPNILSFRPNDWEERAVRAAEEATGFKRSELLRRCVAKALGTVVEDILLSHSTAVQRFTSVLNEQTNQTSTAPMSEKSVTYKITKRAHDPPKRKTG